MEFADKGLNPQAEALEDAQTRIRIAVRDGWMSNKAKAVINAEVQRIIRAALKDVKVPDLRDAAYRSLNAFAERQYNMLRQAFGVNPTTFLTMLALAPDSGSTPQERASAMSAAADNPQITYETNARGIPLQEYSQDYIEQKVIPAFDELLKQKALDPDDISGTNSLRNRAEMEVRYAAHTQNIEELRAAGVKLVVASVHADCSDRCYKWQGRIYSLDGTSGTTEDGKPYVPLETATEVYYTTKAGKTYRNGLLGFNCRHYLIPYKPRMVIPHVSRETQQRENAINIRQRELERRVREQREKALIFRNIDRELYLKARRRAIAANKEYMKFSKDNGRAYYPSRVKLL